ncbi:unnamed protein product [Rotaria sp. Silwood2]|nr:unnamed protein product [Rotaria sp. Silwood2]
MGSSLWVSGNLFVTILLDFRSELKIQYLDIFTFDHISYAIRQLSNMTQQARAAFQYATLNVFQMSSRQQQGQALSNTSLSSNVIAFAQLQAMQQQKSSSIHRTSGSLRTTP